MKWPKESYEEPKGERHLVTWEPPRYRRIPEPTGPLPGPPMLTQTKRKKHPEPPPPSPPPSKKKQHKMPNYKGVSAAVLRRRMQKRMRGHAGKLQEDELGYNTQTMGNKRYKVGSPGYKALEEYGEARIQETPHGKGHQLGAKLPRAAITRRLERQKKKASA